MRSKEISKKQSGSDAGINDDRASLSGTAHITPVGGNIFLDLGFPPEEAERLKEESGRRISGKKREVRYNVSAEGEVFVARCLDFEVTSDGPTEAAAVAALKEALELYFDGSQPSPNSHSGQSSKSSGKPSGSSHGDTIMRVNEQLSFSGPFRLDTVRRTSTGNWIFDLKVVIRKTGAAAHSGYILMATDPLGKGLSLQACECVTDLQLALDPDFDLAGIKSIPEASARFCRRLIELGLGPAYDQKNQVVSTFTPGSFGASSGALVGNR